MSMLCIFILLVFYMGCAHGNVPDNSETFVEKEYITYYKYIIDQMKAGNIKENLRYQSKLPHHPGGKRNTELAKHIAEKWRKSGFDKVEEFTYNIYFSNPTRPGQIHLLKDEATKMKMVIGNEPAFDPSERKGEPLYPFNAYSPSGDVTAEFVYVNYGHRKDFDILEKLGVNVSGKILIIRYGKIGRGSKVLNAELRGAIGVILYTDPTDYSISGQEYPSGKALNEYGVQRGTINRLAGDALSLGYPSKPKYFRSKEEKYTGNPIIPSQPISYSSAYNILKFMRDDSIPLPDGFQGGLNFTYVLQSGKDRKIRLNVSTKLESGESLTVCASLFGSDEPDRYVMLGAHRDSWVYGASDDSSGTATIMEIVRTFGHIKKTLKWRPRRSIMACSWGAEEGGTLGSTEWADENHKFITGNVVAYLNLDIVVSGKYIVNLKALEFLREGIHEVAKFVQSPENQNNKTHNKTLFQEWAAKSFASGKTFDTQRPKFSTPYSYSDYKSLWHTYGTTLANFNYDFNEKEGNAYGHYHTLYDSFAWLEKFIDPKFNYHLAIGQFVAGYSLLLADAIIIPFDLVAYTEQVKFYLNDFHTSYYSMLETHKISLSLAHERLDALMAKAKLFHEYVKDKSRRKSIYEIRSINDKLMNFERNFLIKGISKTLTARHVVYSAISNEYKPTKRFPGISEAIYFASQNPSDDWDEVRKQMTLVVWCFDTANRALDFDEWTTK